MRLKLPPWALENISTGGAGVQCGYCLMESWVEAYGEVPHFKFTVMPTHHEKCPEFKNAGIPITLTMEP